MAAQNDPNIPASSSNLHSLWQQEHLSSKFHRKSKLLMKSNVNVETPDSCGTTSMNSESSVPLQQSPSEMTIPVTRLDMQPITHPPSVITTAKTLGIAKNLQQSKQAASATPLSPASTTPTLPSPTSHRPQAIPLNNATSLASSDNNFAPTLDLQSLTEIQHTPLTEDQIDDAKNLVLDLLGWGVDPEYLVTSGVHPELIYRIFTDLNLRLPTNLVL